MFVLVVSRTRDVNSGFLGKPVIGFGKPVLNRLLVLLTFIVLYKTNDTE